MAVGQVVPEALTYMAAFDQSPGESCECWGEMIQAGGTANAKALRLARRLVLVCSGGEGVMEAFDWKG